MLVATHIQTNEQQGPESVPGLQDECMSWLTSVQLNSLLLLQTRWFHPYCLLDHFLIQTIEQFRVGPCLGIWYLAQPQPWHSLLKITHRTFACYSSLWSYTSVDCNTWSLYVHFSVECLLHSISRQYKPSSLLGFVFYYVFYNIVCRSS